MISGLLFTPNPLGSRSLPTMNANSSAFPASRSRIGSTAILDILKSVRGARLTAVWMTAVILSHIFVLGYGWFFVDALMVMLLAVIYLLLTRSRSHWSERKSVGTMSAVQTHQK